MRAGFARATPGWVPAMRLPRTSYSLSRPGEVKGMDTDIDIALGSVPSTTNTNDAIIVLNLVQSGTGSWNRIGKRIKLKSVRCRGELHHTYTDAATTGDIAGSLMRISIVYDRQPSGATIPTFDTIFGRTDQSGTESTEMLDSLKWDNTDRFRVLTDRVIEGNPQLFDGAGGTGDIVTQRFAFDYYVKLKDLDCVFLGQSVPMTIADISTGALYIIFRANSNVTTNRWAVNMSTARLRYRD